MRYPTKAQQKKGSALLRKERAELAKKCQKILDALPANPQSKDLVDSDLIQWIFVKRAR